MSRGGQCLQLAQRLETSGARTVLPFVDRDRTYLAVPQVARDIAERPPNMNGGNSNASTVVYQWDKGRFVEFQRLDVPGGEDAEYFSIGDRRFVAIASLKSGTGPYDFNTLSTIFEWRAGALVPFQAVPTFAAKQWRHFTISGRHFLGLAQGIRGEGKPAHPASSTILEWDGVRFVRFQDVPSEWGYNWLAFEIDGVHFLAYADHIEKSRLFRWSSRCFEPLFEFEGPSGRAFCVFEEAGEHYLGFANLAGESILYRWNGSSLAPHQTLGGPGLREFATRRIDGVTHVVLARFITGPREAPKPEQRSQLCRWEDGGLRVVEEVECSGVTSAAFFNADGQDYLAVASSLGPDLRFRTDSHVYRLSKEASA